MFMPFQFSGQSLPVKMVSLRLPLSWLIILFCGLVYVNCELEEYFKWKQITFASVEKDGDDVQFPSRISAEKSADYVAYNNVPMGATHYKGKIFLTVPRRRVGVPSTLNFVYTKSTKGSNPSFKAFPSEDINRLHPSLQPDPNRIISVYRTRLDECNRLWWIDTGLLEYPDNATQVQRPSIWVYDLERDQVVHRFEIPQSIVERGNGMASITVDVDPNNCQNAYGYIPDLAQYRFYVYSLSQNRIWSFRHNYFHFDPIHGDFDVVGLKYQWDDGIFSITLGNRQPDGYRKAYFHPMASVSEFAVSTRVLQNEQNAARSYHGNDFQFLGQRGPYTQSAMHAFDRNSGIIFYSQVYLNGIACWNSNTRHTPQDFHQLERNNQTMIYPSDLNIDQEGYLWVFTNTMPRFIYAQLNPSEYNFRLWRASTRDIVRNSLCADVRGVNHFHWDEINHREIHRQLDMIRGR